MPLNKTFDDYKNEVAQLKEESKAWEDVVKIHVTKIHVTKINELQSTLDEIKTTLTDSDKTYGDIAGDIVIDVKLIKKILAKHEDNK